MVQYILRQEVEKKMNNEKHAKVMQGNQFARGQHICACGKTSRYPVCPRCTRKQVNFNAPPELEFIHQDTSLSHTVIAKAAISLFADVYEKNKALALKYLVATDA